MAKTWVEEFVSNEAGMRSFLQERAILEVTELICEALEARGITRTEFAKMLGKTKGWVTQLLDGEGNKTIRTVADVLAALGMEMHVTARPVQIGRPGNGKQQRSQGNRRSGAAPDEGSDPKASHAARSSRDAGRASPRIPEGGGKRFREAGAEVKKTTKRKTANGKSKSAARQ